MSMEPRRRAFLGVSLPLAALVAAAIMIWSMSRVFLAAPEEIGGLPGAPIIGLLFALNILVAAAVAASLRHHRAVIGLIIAVAVPVMTAGVVGFVAGERPVHSLVAEGGGHEGGGGVSDTVEIEAHGLAFDVGELTLPADTEVTVIFTNSDDGIPHNWAMYTEQGGEAIFQGEIITGPGEIEYTFTTPGPGDYFFQCDLHPDMTGMVTVVPAEGGPPGGGGDDGGAGGGGASITASGLAFDTAELAFPPETEVTLEFTNEDESIPHNWAAYIEQGGEPIFQGEIITGPDTVEYTFTTPPPGEYFFQCDLHPTTMSGTLVVG